MKGIKVKNRIMVAVVLLAGMLSFVTPSASAAQYDNYTVRPGDTLWGIAIAYGFDSWYPIYEANQGVIPDPQSLTIGTVLYIPTVGLGMPQQPIPVPVSEPAAPTNSSGGIEDIITEAAYRYGQSPSAMMAVAWCESRYDPSAYNPSSAASGLFQFLPSTWASTPYASSNIFNAYANANAAAWMWSVGRRGEWVC